MTFLFYFQPFLVDGYFITQNERSIKNYEKDIQAIMYGLLSLCDYRYRLADYTAVHAESKQYWTDKSNERVGIVEKVMNDGSIGSTFNEGLFDR